MIVQHLEPIGGNSVYETFEFSRLIRRLSLLAARNVSRKAERKHEQRYQVTWSDALTKSVLVCSSKLPGPVEVVLLHQQRQLIALDRVSARTALCAG